MTDTRGLGDEDFLVQISQFIYLPILNALKSELIEKFLEVNNLGLTIYLISTLVGKFQFSILLKFLFQLSFNF